MKSFIKILGPPVLMAIKELEKVAVDMPQVCIMDTTFLRDVPYSLARDVGGRITERNTRVNWIGNYYKSHGVSITHERCENIISNSAESLGEYDFFFEWLKEPSSDQLNELLIKIDEALEPLGCFYKIVTK